MIYMTYKNDIYDKCDICDIYDIYNKYEINMIYLYE